ncbi:MAG: hypothetical protein FWJ74_08495 [Gemmatimonadota bacterium]|jgi:hypothetical protein
MTGAKHAFVVGRRTRRGLLVMIVQRGKAPIRGPWTLKAVVSAN